MNRTQLYYVKSVIEQKSFSRAAKKIGITQPALSAYIAKIENTIGTKIFDRSTSPMVLTEAGEEYVRYITEIIKMTDEFDNFVSDLNNLKTGKIVIGSTHCYSSSYLPAAIVAFKKKYPNVNVQIVDGRIPDIEEKCFNAEVDLFIAPPNVDSAIFSLEPIFEERIFVLVPRGNPINETLRDYQIPHEEIVSGVAHDKEYPELDIKALANEDFVLMNHDLNIRQIANDVFLRAEMHPHEVMTVNQMMTSFALTLAGEGVSFLPETAIRFGNFANHPIYYMVDKDVTCRTISLGHKKNKPLSKAGIMFTEEFKEQMKIAIGNK